MSPSSFQIRSERRRSTPPERTEKGVQAALLVGMAADQAVFTDSTLILTRLHYLSDRKRVWSSTKLINLRQYFF